MNRYFEREESLFAEWESRLQQNEPDADFVPDGLLYRGPIEYVDKDGFGFWTRYVGNEADQWDSANIRLLVLTKDLNDEDGGWDIREETGRLNNTGSEVIKTCRKYIYPNLTIWAYGLLNAANGRGISEYDMIPSWDELREFYETAPIARVNCKKSVGASSCSNSLLNHHLQTYGDLLLQQIQMYDADIILCCGGSGLIKDFVKRNYLLDLQKISESGWVYYSPSRNKVVIDSYHPSCRYSTKSMYEDMMDDMNKFLDNYAEFLNKHR